ncbi:MULTISPECIES: shikimate dehydrogenase family protein [unclassified Luteococcus]|uniref:shikimate dehydrogenase family protein n=1 Tax=unclassified Luteococcus TaxID=2639923 RepID=UPI00313C008B
MPGLTGQRCAVIGHPAGHSLSPALHLAAYRELGLDWGYTAVDLAPEQLDGFVRGLDESWRGLSVTMPHKVAIRQYGQGDELVDLVGAANTLVLPQGRNRTRAAEGVEAPRQARGTSGVPLVRNTDVGGYQLAFAEAGIESADSATVVGNGATARSAVVALRQMGVERVLVLARRPERARELKSFCTNALGMLCAVRELAPGQVIDSDILLSTVPEGGADHLAAELVQHAAVVFDSVYDPWPSALAVEAERAGKLVLNGLDLLAGQAVEQVRLMTGAEVSFGLLKSAGQEALKARAQL